MSIIFITFLTASAGLKLALSIAPSLLTSFPMYQTSFQDKFFCFNYCSIASALSAKP
jgi:hypothetical protein